MKLDDVKKLHQKKYRQEMGFFLVEGEHLILELEKAVARFPLLKNSVVYATEAHTDTAPNLTKIIVSEKQMQQLSETKTPQGILAAVPIHFKDSPAVHSTRLQKAIYLSEIQDPGNLGTIMRTTAWFGGFNLLLSPNSVDAFNGKTIRASMGAIFHIDIQENVSVAQLKEYYSRFACLGMTGNSIRSHEFTEFDCYLFGNEARGLDQSMMTQLSPTQFTISGTGTIDSLNLATAVSVSCYELKK